MVDGVSHGFGLRNNADYKDLSQSQNLQELQPPAQQLGPRDQTGGGNSSERLNTSPQFPRENTQNDPAFANQGQDRLGIPDNNEGHSDSGMLRDNGSGSGLASQNTFSRGNSVGNNGSSGLASGFFGHGSAGGTPYTTSLGGLSTSLLNMGLPAFAALPTFIPSFEPKRDSEPPYRPQVQPQPPQPQPRPEPQPAIQAQQAATQAATTQAATRAEAQAASTQAASVRQQEARAAAGQTPTPQTATQAALQAQRLTPAALAAITRTLAAHQQQAARMGALLMAAAGMARLRRVSLLF